MGRVKSTLVTLVLGGAFLINGCIEPYNPQARWSEYLRLYNSLSDNNKKNRQRDIDEIQEFARKIPYSRDKPCEYIDDYKSVYRWIHETGDCEDIAIGIAVLLHRIGYPPKILKLLPPAVDGKFTTGHAVALVEHNGKFGLVEKDKRINEVYDSIDELVYEYNKKYGSNYVFAGVTTLSDDNLYEHLLGKKSLWPYYGPAYNKKERVRQLDFTEFAKRDEERLREESEVKEQMENFNKSLND